MKKLFVLALVAIVSMGAFAAPRQYEITSPDGSLKATVVLDKDVTYSVSKAGECVLAPSKVSMALSDGTVFGAAGFRKADRLSVDRVLDTPLYKKSSVRDNYNQLTLTFKTHKLVFRAFDSGVAYRFVSLKKGEYQVMSETAEFAFPADHNAWIPYVKRNKKGKSPFMNSFENPYTCSTLSGWNKEGFAFLPVMVEGPQGIKVNIMESDLLDYPGMYLGNKDGNSTLEAVFAPYPKTIEQGGHNMLQGLVTEAESYIAKCNVAASFPWRIVAVSSHDKDMLNNDLVWLLGTPADTAADWSWVKPGKVAWEWWNDWNITGVDFKAGVNNDTYKYYIDFASRNGIEYVILDEGWAVNLQADLFQVIPEIDLEELVAYGRERNVGIVLWAGYWAFERDIEKVCEHYSKMGIKGWKIDFMDRDDQAMVDFYRRAAETSAKYHMFVDFHGAFKPSGQNRTYPNVLNFEGVYGLENMKWLKKGHDQISYDVQIPFIRMAAGPMDYTQGAMLNAGRNAVANNTEPMSQGTRCHQMGMYVVIESPFNMLCDSPVHYDREKECTQFIAGVPTVWDETVALEGKVGDYAVIARRKGDVWYIGGLTGWQARTAEIDFGFLGEGEWRVEIFCDGVNVDKNAKDYKRILSPAGKSLKVEMASGGGFAARISRKL